MKRCPVVDTADLQILVNRPFEMNELSSVISAVIKPDQTTLFRTQIN